jgi:hypothetical protein
VPLTTVLGFCIGKVVYLRSSAISQKSLTRVALSNSTEGLVRTVVLFILINQLGEIGVVSVIIAYLSGNLASLIPYIKSNQHQFVNRLPSIPPFKIYSLSIIGLLTSLISGGIPYLAGFFEINSIGILLFFFTLSRSLLILQSLLVYVNPTLAKKIGGKTSLRGFLKVFPILYPLTSVILLLCQISIQELLGINLSEINRPEILIFSLALILGGFLNLKSASVNVSSAWKYSLISGILGFFASSLCLLLISSGKVSFYMAITVGPIIAILISTLADKAQESESNNS